MSTSSTYAGVCLRMLAYAGVCWRMLTYAEVTKTLALRLYVFSSSFICLERGCRGGPLYLSSYVSIRQHTPAYASIRSRGGPLYLSYLSIRQHTPACVDVSIRKRQHTPGGPLYLSAHVFRQHTSAYLSIRQHT
jgi:hypothetical protein